MDQKEGAFSPGYQSGSYLDDKGKLIELALDDVEIKIEYLDEPEVGKELRCAIEKIEERFPKLSLKPARMSASLYRSGAVSWLCFCFGSDSSPEYWYNVDEFTELDLRPSPVID